MSTTAKRGSVVKLRHADTEEEGLAELVEAKELEDRWMGISLAFVLDLSLNDYQLLLDYVLGQVYPLARA